MTVSQRFTAFLNSIAVTSVQEAAGSAAHKSVRRCLNAAYHSVSSESANSFLTGSWAKSTQIRPPRDVDMFFVLPDSVYSRYQLRPGNRQSQLLQEVKNVLQRQFGTTSIRGDGPAVVVGFTGYSVEVIPAFIWGTQYRICNTTNGGSYIVTDPKADIAKMVSVNSSNGGKSRDLIRMLKKWQENCSVPLKSFVIELLVNDFLPSYEHKDKTMEYYDYMVRDFFKWLVNKGEYSYVTVPGTYNTIWIGGA